MAHSYDSTLSTTQRKVVRDAVVARLAPLLVSSGKYLSQIQPIGFVAPAGNRSEINDEERAMLHEIASGKTPCVLVAVGDKRYQASGMSTKQDNWSCEIEVHVYAISQHARDLTTRLAGDVASAASDTKDPGIWTILEHLEELLIGFQPEDAGTIKTIHALRPAAEEELDVADDMSIWRQRYTTKLERFLTRSKGVTQALTQIRTEHDVVDENDTALPSNPIVTTETDLP